MTKPAKTGFEKFLDNTPQRAEFTITMDADSTTEVWADINTGLDDAQAWLMYGMEYSFENVTPTVPLSSLVGIADICTQLQLHRNDASELMLAQNNNLVIVTHKVNHTRLSSGAILHVEPFKVAINNVTLQPTLRVIFRTSADLVNISAATVRLSGVIFYDVISAPSRLTSKLGTLTDL